MLSYKYAIFFFYTLESMFSANASIGSVFDSVIFTNFIYNITCFNYITKHAYV